MKVKVCGITCYDDAACAVESGATMIGFIFADSPRKISVSQAGGIITRLDNQSLLRSVRTVGVFVNQTSAVMGETLDAAGISYAQIHGDETADVCNSFLFPWFKALRIGSEEQANGYSGLIRELTCSMIIADSLSTAAYGGTGMQVERDAAKQIGTIIRSSGKEFFLAGGLNHENAADIIREIRPDGIDLSSGLEMTPGKKSHIKIRALFTLIKSLETDI